MKRFATLLACAAPLLILSANAMGSDSNTSGTSLESAMPAIQNATSIVEGASARDAKTTLYVFMDPNCIYCHIAWKALQPYEAEGLSVHWIPLGFLKPDSAGKAAALLEAQDRDAMMKTLETNYSEKDESGGIAPLKDIPFDAQNKLNANMRLFESLGFSGTPTVVYRDSTGKWASIDGLPRLGGLPKLLGLPERPLADAELQKYR